MAVLLVHPYLQFFDDDGNPLAGGKVYTYEAGTSTPKATYTDATGVSTLTNPVILDAAGRTVMWGIGSYKFIVKDSLDSLIREVDGVTSFTVTPASSSAFFQSFSGTGLQTAFTLSSAQGTDENAIMVFVDAGAGKGYEIVNPAAYTLNGTSLTFSVAPASGTNNIYVFAPSSLVGAASQSAAAAAASDLSAGVHEANALGYANVAKAAAGFAYTYDTDTTASDPGAGLLRYNNATLASATQLYINETTGLAQAISAVIATWDDSTSAIHGQLRMFKQGDPSIFVIYDVTGAITDNGAWDTVPVTYVGSSGVFADNDVVTLQFVRNGDKGDTGATGATGGVVPFAVAAGTVDAITANFSPDIALADGQLCIVRSGGANTITNPTFAPDGLTARTIVTGGGQPLVAGDTGLAGYPMLLQYNLASTRWELMNPAKTAEFDLSLSDVTTGDVSTTRHGFVPKGTNVGKYLRDDGTWADITGANTNVFHIQNEQASGTSASAGTSTAWTKFPLNTTILNTIASASLSSDVISLPAGTYLATFSAVFTAAVSNYVAARLRLRNTTDGSTIVQGPNLRGYSASYLATGQVKFTIAATKNIELQYYKSAGSIGPDPMTTGENEVWASIMIEKVA